MTLVYRVAKLRFVDKPPDNAPWRRLHAVADRAVPAAEKAFLRALQDFRNAIDVDEFAAAVALRTDADMAVVMLPWATLERAIERRLLPILRNVRDGGAEVTAGNLSTLLRRDIAVAKAEKKKPDRKQQIVAGGTISFDMRNPRAEAHIAQHGARLVQQVTNETRSAIRQVVLRAQQRGEDVRSQAKKIATILRRDVGLTVQQANALANLEAKLVADATPPARVQATIANRRTEMVGQRARTIARNETLTAANEGQQEAWRQAKDERLLPAEPKRKWLTQRHVNANNPCPICEPMNGQLRGLEEPFVSPYNGASALSPPMHISCLCVAVLEIPDP